ncbi:2-amino-4-hydroxy-6-hydroxymethyldihydropteridine diphosphokinase [Erythrobacter neustonensis]|uniref:2-amino-4-hydroxy-6- hydroxymethyldihydropteridine diphosphokinase n=1 Tax=Erythrobacter neustonensis TaxID=1112 RepID=UPI003AAE6A10
MQAAMEELAAFGTVTARSPIIATPAMGAAQRRFANAAAVLESELDPPSLLAACKHTERAFGRRPGQRWGDRVLDLDIVLWSGGVWASKMLTIPHPAFAQRRFVLDPACAIAADWRTRPRGLRLIHHQARLTRPRPLPR